MILTTDIYVADDAHTQTLIHSTRNCGIIDFTLVVNYAKFASFDEEHMGYCSGHQKLNVTTKSITYKNI